MQFIDSHVHLLNPAKFSYGWCAGLPALDRAFSIEDFRVAAAGSEGVTIRSLVLIEADVPAAQQEAETKFFARMHEDDANPPKLGALVAAAWPEAADFPRRLETLAQETQVRGVRRVLHTMPDELSQSATLAENLRLLPRYGYTFDLCLRPHLLPSAALLVARCPETRFVLDHCGVPLIAKHEFEPWATCLRRLAAFPNVACKFSGLASCCDPKRPMTPQVRPYFEHCLACFGPDRMMWGSDWPVCNLTFDLPAWLRTTVDLLTPLSEDERTAIATRTANRVYRLE